MSIARFVYLLPMLSIVAICLFGSGCAPAAYNRYQTADTLGAGEVKIAVTANYSPSPVNQSAEKVRTQMDDRFREWSAPYSGETWVRNLEESFTEPFVYGQANHIYNPNFEAIFAVGVHDSLDFEIRSTHSGYVRFNTKARVFRYKDMLAISIAPGAGYVEYDGEASGDNYTDTANGRMITAELPVIVGWEFKGVSPYAALYLVYHNIDMDYRRQTEGTPYIFDESIKDTYHLYLPGLIGGLQYKHKWCIVTLELTANYMLSDLVNGLVISPGFLVGAQF